MTPEKPDMETPAMHALPGACAPTIPLAARGALIAARRVIREFAYNALPPRDAGDVLDLISLTLGDTVIMRQGEREDAAYWQHPYASSPDRFAFAVLEQRVSRLERIAQIDGEGDALAADDEADERARAHFPDPCPFCDGTGCAGCAP